MKQDILIFLSDQHAPDYSSWGQFPVDTPNLDQLCREGVSFENAYTPCPLCVPARMAMLSGRSPSSTGIFTNKDALSSTTPTFLHDLVSAGYETVLVGRMHFIGPDQRHGFTRRIAPDYTPSGYVWPKSLRDDFGVHTQTIGYKWCTHVVGGGISPVQCYDEMVVQAAETYLAQPHEKPQCIVVGTYGPHFPYVAPTELYRKYLSRCATPDSFFDSPAHGHPMLQQLQEPNREPQLQLACQAAYRGMVEWTDALVGRVRRAFSAYKTLSHRPQLFCYLSDHGDTVGEHGIYGKKTFFQRSARIPMVFAGDGVAKDLRQYGCVSLLDLGITLCSYVQAPIFGESQGHDLLPALQGAPTDSNRAVLSETVDPGPDGTPVYGCALFRGSYKYMVYHGFEPQELLFDLSKDPMELKNLTSEEPNLLAQFRTLCLQRTDPAAAEAMFLRQQRLTHRFAAWETVSGGNDTQRFRDYPPEAKLPPEICVSTLCTPPGKEEKSIFLGLSQ